MVKTINDLDDLVRLILIGLTCTKPWQRQLASRLGDVDRMVQVLRLTIAMAGPDAQIVPAAQDVAGACRRAAASLAGSRADSPSLQAVALVQAGNGVPPILRPVPLREVGADTPAAVRTRPLEREGLMRRKRAGCGRSARPVRRGGCGDGATARVLGHRQTKGAATDNPDLRPPRHISTLPMGRSPSSR